MISFVINGMSFDDWGLEVSGVVVGEGSGDASSNADDDEEPSEVLACGNATSVVLITLFWAASEFCLDMVSLSWPITCRTEPGTVG